MADDKKTLKFQMMMSPQEAERLDDWMFKNRLRSRAEAIRRLCQIALKLEGEVGKVRELQQLFQDILPTIAKAHAEQADPAEIKNALAVLTKVTWELSGLWDEVLVAADVWRDPAIANFDDVSKEVAVITEILRGGAITSKD
jgi:hypothetical protein